MLARVLAITPCPCLCLSVTSRCSIERDERRQIFYVSLRALTCAVIAKFHYTGPTGPDETKSADFVGVPRGPARTLSETRVCGPGLAKKSVRVRSGPAGPV